MDYLYETKVITTSKVLAHNIWKTMHQACVEKLQKSFDNMVEDIESSCNVLIEALKEEYEVFELDEEKLLDNPKITAKRRYAENELRKIYPGYNKTSYHAETLVKNIDVAIENEKKFCEDIEKLEYCIGSNIGGLITQLRN